MAEQKSQADNEVLIETDENLDYSDGWHWTTEAGRWQPGDDVRWTP